MVSFTSSAPFWLTLVGACLVATGRRVMVPRAADFKCTPQCELPDGCGWGEATCVDAGGATWTLERLKKRAGAVPQIMLLRDFALNQCYTPCKDEQAISTMCSVTANHLDEQYGSLESLVDKTCLSAPEGAGQPSPDIVVVMAQELNHASRIGPGKNDFNKYINEHSLPGYALAGVCAPDLSANTAVYVRAGSMEAQVFSAEVQCRAYVTTPCDWTNCKGSSVMSIGTLRGTLTIANWHGFRRGDEGSSATFSEKRLQEFESAVTGIAEQTIPVHPRLVVFGGDTNVRAHLRAPGSVDWAHAETPQDFWELTHGDVLAVPGFTTNDHLAGRGVASRDAQAALEQLGLQQVRGWDTICPTKTKTKDAFYVAKEKHKDVFAKLGSKFARSSIHSATERLFTFGCSTPADQMSDGKQTKEYLRVNKLDGRTSNPPSLTERIFVSGNLYDGCGKMIKDVRNRQDDHDPVFVHCSLPRLSKRADWKRSL